MSSIVPRYADKEKDIRSKIPLQRYSPQDAEVLHSRPIIQWQILMCRIYLPHKQW